MTSIDNRLNLAVIFPPSQGMHGASTRLADMAYCTPRFASRREAALTILRANLEPYIPGKGNRAMRRVLALFPARRMAA